MIPTDEEIEKAWNEYVLAGYRSDEDGKHAFMWGYEAAISQFKPVLDLLAELREARKELDHAELGPEKE